MEESKYSRMGWVGRVARMRDRRVAYRVVVERPLGRLGRRWDDNIKKYLQEVGWGAWTGSVWLRRGTGGGRL